METKTIEVKTEKQIYVAVDGTEFNDANECIRYEESALCVLKARLKKCLVKKTDEDAAFSGDSDHECWILCPKDSEDIKNLLQLLAIYGNTGEKNSDELEDQIGKIVYLSWNCDKDYAWIRTLDSIVKFTFKENDAE